MKTDSVITTNGAAKIETYTCSLAVCQLYRFRHQYSISLSHLSCTDPEIFVRVEREGGWGSRTRGYKVFYPCLTQLSMKFQLLIGAKMLKNKDISCLQTLR